MKHILLLTLPLFFISCSEKKKKDPAQEVLNSALEAHGELGNYYFVFREDLYSFEFSDSGAFRYSKTVLNDSVMYEDVLTNEGFRRSSKADTVSLSQEDVNKYSESLNSVIYFVCLPQKLNDPAANLELMKDATIQGKEYSTIKVTFDQEGGGNDYQDEFYYWFSKKSNELDYFAYSYAVNEGGVRFRQAINPRKVEGMLFQDYINYEAPVGTPLSDLPALFEKDSLKELSRIKITDIMPF